MKPYHHALPLALLLAAACSSGDDDDQPAAGGSGGAGGSNATQGAGGSGAGGAGASGAGGSAPGAGGACATPDVELERAPQLIKTIVEERKASPVAGTEPFLRQDYTGTTLTGVGKVVYYVPIEPGVSDGNSGLVAQDGTVICSPDGGISGDGDGKCGDYGNNHSAPPPGPGKSVGDPCIVWQDPRK